MREALTTPVLPSGLDAEWLQTRDLHCPECEYNLRMLHTPRCPECGLIFRWQALLLVHCPRCNESLFATDDDLCPRCGLALNWGRLLDTADLCDRKMYEYSSQPIRAAVRTWFGALNPWRFWSRIPIETPPVIRRLRLIQWAALVVCVLGIGLATATNWSNLNPFSQWGRHDWRLLVPLLVALVLPAVTLIGLPRFTPTLVRYRVRDDQLRRCLTYALAGVFWIGLFFAVWAGVVALVNVVVPPATNPWASAPIPSVNYDPNAAVGLPQLRRTWPWSWSFRSPADIFVHWTILIVMANLSFAWWWTFLCVGLRRYLRLDLVNTVALLLSTQIVGLLLLILALLAVSRPARRAVGDWLMTLQV